MIWENLTKRNLIKITGHNKLHSAQLFDSKWLFFPCFVYNLMSVYCERCISTLGAALLMYQFNHNDIDFSRAPNLNQRMLVLIRTQTFSPTQQSRTKADQERKKKSGNLQFPFSLRQVFSHIELLKKRFSIVNVTLKTLDQYSICYPLILCADHKTQCRSV